MKHLFKRVEKLEHSEVIVAWMSPMARFLAAREQSALRLLGRSFDSIASDKTLWLRVYDDLSESYIPKMSDADLATLRAEFAGRLSAAEMAAAKAEFAAEHGRESHL